VKPPGPAALLVERAGAMGVAVAPGLAGTLVALLDRMALEPQNLTAIEGITDGVERHLADSLSALTLAQVAAARTILDLGSGGGFPGLPLALALPGAVVTLVESERRKAAWLVRASGGVPNVRVVADRAETLARREPGRWEVVTARAVGPLPVVLELAAPLLGDGGHLVAWRGPRDPGEEARGAAAAAELGLTAGPVQPVEPFPGARRHLHTYRKDRPTPSRYPRRPGRAARRPLGG
jgi:16S rRNA (guanine527-N7)-methyltransferase